MQPNTKGEAIVAKGAPMLVFTATVTLHPDAVCSVWVQGVGCRV